MMSSEGRTHPKLSLVSTFLVHPGLLYNDTTFDFRVFSQLSRLLGPKEGVSKRFGRSLVRGPVSLLD